MGNFDGVRDWAGEGSSGAGDRRHPSRLSFSENVVRMMEASSELAALCHKGDIREINSAGRRLIGCDGAEDIVGSAFSAHVAGDYAPIVEDLLGLSIVEAMPVPVQLRRPDKQLVDVDLRVLPARELGDGTVVVTARDISREGRLARSSRETDWRFRQLVEHGLALICLCSENRITYINPAGARMLGAKSARDLHGAPVFEIFGGVYREVFTQEMATLMEEGAMVPVCLARLDGGKIDVQIRVTRFGNAKGSNDFMIEARDITPHNRAVAALRLLNETLESQIAERTAELRRLAITDPLTGVANRRHFMELMESEWQRAKRHRHPLSLVMLDIDLFKRINDNWGHPTGDIAIKAVADICRLALRPLDQLGRLGGEEFGILLPETAAAAARDVAESLRAAVASLSIPAGGGTISLSASFGVSECDLENCSAEALIAQADRALYAAKHDGRNRVVLG